MLYNILAPYAHSSHMANLFTYISLRSGMAVVISMILTLYLMPKLINYLQMLSAKGQPIRDDGPATHQGKIGTPTMGGLMIVASSMFSVLLVADLSNPFIWISSFVFVSFTVLGFIDDYVKVTKSDYHGISGKMKIIWQFSVSVIAFMLIQYYTKDEFATVLNFPFLKKLAIDIGYFYIPFAIIVIVGSSNAVNLTDGLDGLAIGCCMIAVAAFAVICYMTGNAIYANYLQVMHIYGAGELTVFCAAIIGSSLGFLWYNAHPAEIFMGDTGSLSLGGFLGVISLITKHEIVLSIIGGIFVIEAISVIMQVLYFKKTGGRRIFLMAPLHHHYEKKGWPESKVIVRFWIMAIIFALVGIASLKLR